MLCILLTYPADFLVFPVITGCLLSLLDKKHLVPAHGGVLGVRENEVGHADLGIRVEESIQGIWN